MVVVGKVRAYGEVDTPAWRERFGVVRPDDGTLLHVRGCTIWHRMHGDGLDLHGI